MTNYTDHIAIFRGSLGRTLLILLLLAVTFMTANAASITLKVWNDANGNAQKANPEAFINGSTIPLWINLTDITTDQVIGQASVNSTGVATITGAVNGAAYKLILTSTQPTLGTTLTSASVPSNYVHTGINMTSNATGAGDMANQTGIIEINMPASGNLANINFGIEQLPAALSITATNQQNPNGNYKVAVVSPNAVDAEDGNIWTTGTGTVVIETLPTDGTLYYNGLPVTPGQSITNFNDEL
ncbi:hypothetical protein, partial [Dyadobacter tibetensis]|uniref:hypothetical protein n=1 Tax=Dyadobacter tibetensis TaxID=1211851 RepID=UPI0012FB511A